MSIGVVGSANSYFYNKVNGSNNRNNGTDRFDRFGIATASNAREASEQSSRFSAYDAYKSATVNVNFKSEIGERYLQSLNANNGNGNLLAQAKGEVQKVDNERYLIDVSDEIEGYWYIYDKESNHSFTFNPLSTSIQTDENTGRDYIVSCDSRGQLMNVMYADHALMESIKTFLQTDNITKSTLNDKYTIEVNAFTGIECLKVKGQEGNGSWTMMTDQEQLDKLQELANLYREKYPNLVNSDGLALGLAKAEVAGQCVRTEHGFMMIACNGMQYMDDADSSKSWGVMWSINDTDIYNKIIQAMTDGRISGSDIEDYEIWKAFFEEQEIEFEKALSDEELAAIANPSFTVTSYEEIMKDWEEQIKANQEKNYKPLAEVILEGDPQARYRLYKLAGSSKVYTFDEYVRNIEEELRKRNEK